MQNIIYTYRERELSYIHDYTMHFNSGLKFVAGGFVFDWFGMTNAINGCIDQVIKDAKPLYTQAVA